MQKGTVLFPFLSEINFLQEENIVVFFNIFTQKRKKSRLLKESQGGQERKIGGIFIKVFQQFNFLISQSYIVTPSMEPTPELPILHQQEEITSLINSERVTIVSGKTGCGKSTQVPQFIIKANPNAKVAVCEPRRLAATSLAARVGSQMASTVGNLVGYHIGMEPKMCSNSKVIFMTYGILIQELLFRKSIGYTHIILDEVHERSLEMDLAFITLKQILDQEKNINIKIIIMSATINSEKFRNYFSVHKEKEHFMKPRIQLFFGDPLETKQRKRGSRRKRSVEKKRLVLKEMKADREEEYRPSKSIEIKEKKLHKTEIFYVDQFLVCKDKNKKVFDVFGDDIKITDDGYQLVVETIMQFRQKDDGDILIFVPGMMEIKLLKDLLIKKNSNFKRKIVQVHSAYSDQLYHQLFVEKISSKIIIATNIGQSSITLTECKLVIDFCLSRKNISVEGKGYTKFCTVQASKSNLIQRAGRVGRVADGLVYRLITKDEFSEMSDFQTPQIKCVSLEMVILRIKQLHKTHKSEVFEDPYHIIMSIMEPPEPEEIQKSLEFLLEEKALTYKHKKQEENEIYKGNCLKLTEVGEFMVSMPCSFEISKMILFSFQLGIAYTMINIGSIMMAKKHFFVQEDRRRNIENFLHHFIEYDDGNFNDYSLRQNLFCDWKKTVFEPFVKQYRKNNRDENLEEDQNILQSFCCSKVSSMQSNWAKERGVYTSNMRDILRINQSIRNKIKAMKIQVKQQKYYPENELIILCMMMAFPSTAACSVQWKQKRQPENVIRITAGKKFKVAQIQQELPDYLYPYKAKRISSISEGYNDYVQVEGCPSILAKLVLPRSFVKCNLDECTPLFRYLAQGNSKVFYPEYEEGSPNLKNSAITILNDSINKLSYKVIQDDYLFISNNIFNSKYSLYMNASALVTKKVFLLFKILTQKKVKLTMHPSRQFVSEVSLGDRDKIVLPFFITNKIMEKIFDLRSYSLWEKPVKLEEQSDDFLHNAIMNLLSSLKDKPIPDNWEEIFIQNIEKLKQPIEYDIEQLPELKEPQISFYQRYRKWKNRQHRDLSFHFKLYNTLDPLIICKQCYNNYITEVEQLSAYCPKAKTLQINEFRGSWKRQGKNFYCRYEHFVAEAINENEALIEYENLLIYTPYNRVHQFSKETENFDQIKEKGRIGEKELFQQRSELNEFECLICSRYDEHEQTIQYVRIENNGTEHFWKKVKNHVHSKKHFENVDKFLK